MPSALVIEELSPVTSVMMRVGDLYVVDLPNASCLISEVHDGYTKLNLKREQCWCQYIILYSLPRISSFYTNIKALVWVLCTLPVTSCTVETSFSSLKNQYILLWDPVWVINDSRALLYFIFIRASLLTLTSKRGDSVFPQISRFFVEVARPAAKSWRTIPPSLIWFSQVVWWRGVHPAPLGTTIRTMSASSNLENKKASLVCGDIHLCAQITLHPKESSTYENTS